jgi:two-component system sensor histidine kinase ResE
MGVGLFLTRKIIEAHGGHIHVVSSKEKGTTFTITLPGE